GALGVARSENATVTLSFARSAPSSLQFAVGSNERLRVVPERQTCAVAANAAHAGFALEPVRRGEGVIEALWARWQGPLGLCWKQRHDTVNRTVAILPNIAAVKEEAVRLFQRDVGTIGLRAQLRPGEGAEFNALKEFQAGMDRRTIDWKQTARHGK